MNFKLTKWKIIISLLGGIIEDILLVKDMTMQCLMVRGANGYCSQPFWYQHMFDSGAIVMSVIIMLLIYIIWSLIQKK